MERDSNVRVCRRELAPKDGHCTAAKTCGFLSLSCPVEHHAKVGERDGHVGMAWAEQLFLDRERASEQRLGLFEPTACARDRSEVVEIHRDFVVLRSVCALERRQHIAIDASRRRVATSALEDRCEHRAIGGDIDMIFAEQVRSQPDGASCFGLGPRKEATRMREPGEVVVDRRPHRARVGAVFRRDAQRASIEPPRFREAAP